MNSTSTGSLLALAKRVSRHLRAWHLLDTPIQFVLPCDEFHIQGIKFRELVKPKEEPPEMPLRALCYDQGPFIKIDENGNEIPVGSPPNSLRPPGVADDIAGEAYHVEPEPHDRVVTTHHMGNFAWQLGLMHNCSEVDFLKESWEQILEFTAWTIADWPEPLPTGTGTTRFVIGRSVPPQFDLCNKSCAKV